MQSVGKRKPVLPAEDRDPTVTPVVELNKASAGQALAVVFGRIEPT
jgi:hypothetical protein